MVDERLVIYIKDCMRRGYSLDYIRQMLVNEGWKANRVDEAINFIQAPSPPPPGSPPAQAKQKAPSKKPSVSLRPTGVTIICILGFLLSILALLTGIVSIGLAEILGGAEFQMIFGSMVASAISEEIDLFTIIGVISIIMGIVGLVAFYLLLKMKRTGWIIVTVLGVIQIAVSLIPSLMSFSIEGLLNLNTILPIAIWVIIIGYLFAKRNLFV